MSALAAMRSEVYDACAAQAKAHEHPHPHVKEGAMGGAMKLMKALPGMATELHKGRKAYEKALKAKGFDQTEIGKMLELHDTGARSVADNWFRQQPPGPSMGRQAAVATLASLPMLGIALGIPAGQSLIERRKQRGRYQRMLERNPELAQKDPNKVRESYEVLESFAPAMTKNP